MAKLTQTQAGKAFEYALIRKMFVILNKVCNIEIINNKSLENAKKYYNIASKFEQDNYNKASVKAVNHLILLEPKLISTYNKEDLISLSLVPDIKGQKGDVRDILVIRKAESWEIGISAKNNHKAVKHSRLSNHIDFGKKWLGYSSSQEYFHSINPLFLKLEELRNRNIKWRDIENKHDEFYVPILKAFKLEIKKLYDNYGSDIPKNLLKYLIGKNDFYKVIKQQNLVEIQAFNLFGNLNIASNTKEPAYKIPKLKLPTSILHLDFASSSKTTLILTCNNGWQIKFRIHSASTKVEPSLKFDINLISHPQNLYSNNIFF